MSMFHTISGFEECYPVSLLKALSAELKETS